MKNLLGNIALACGSIVFTLVVAEIVLQFLPVTGVARTQPLGRDGSAFDVSSVKNGSITYSSSWRMENPLDKRTNNYGFFSSYDYVQGASTVLAIGDSYTEAAQVEFENTYHQRLAAAIRRPVYNLGLSGAPLSQYEAYLAEGCKVFRPTTAIFAIIHNDFDESFRAYRARNGFFHYSDNATPALTPTPYKISFLRRIVTQSSLVRYMFFNLNMRHYFRQLTSGSAKGHQISVSFSGSSSVDVSVSKRAIDIFLSRIGTYCLAKNRIIFLTDTDRQAIYGGFERRDEAMMYFRDRARALGFRTIDLHPAFARSYARDGVRFESPTDPHWDRHGHKIVGDLLAEEFKNPFYHRQVASQAN